MRLAGGLADLGHVYLIIEQGNIIDDGAGDEAVFLYEEAELRAQDVEAEGGDRQAIKEAFALSRGEQASDEFGQGGFAAATILEDEAAEGGGGGVEEVEQGKGGGKAEQEVFIAMDGRTPAKAFRDRLPKHAKKENKSDIKSAT